MDRSLFGKAIGKFLAGVVLMGLLLFLPAGTFNWRQAWLLMGILFVPMFVAGLVMMKKSPELLKKRLNAKEEQNAEDDTRPLISDEYLTEAYNTLSQFCASYDFDSVAHAVESLSAYRMPEDEVTRYELLVKAVDNYDYELIPGILDRGKDK